VVVLLAGCLDPEAATAAAAAEGVLAASSTVTLLPSTSRAWKRNVWFTV